MNAVAYARKDNVGQLKVIFVKKIELLASNPGRGCCLAKNAKCSPREHVPSGANVRDANDLRSI